MSRATHRVRRLLYISSFYSSFSSIIFSSCLYLFIFLLLFVTITVEASEARLETTTLKTEKTIHSVNFEDQKATTAKMIERIRDESVERLLKLKIGMPSTSFADTEEDYEEEFDEDQNVNDDSLGEKSISKKATSMTPSYETFSSSTVQSSSASSEASGAFRGRRSLRHSHHHRRRRKGCPTVQGKTQFLCPTRNSNRYDVCITREQLCNHIVDCPDGEDEDPKHCMFYQPIDDQLKTLSHAVLLLVDNVMGREQPKAEL
jgi:hypothetical protein